jgi:hypothetical protein
MKQIHLTAISTCLVILVFCSVASSQQPDVIYACQNTKSGKLRAIAVTTPTCNKKEVLVSWYSTEGLPSANYVQFTNLNNGAVDVSSTWTKLNTTSTSHSFMKNGDDTTIEVIVNSRFWGGTFGSGTNGIEFQVRIDDTILPDVGNYGSITATNTSQFLSIYGVFQGLPVGSHTVSLWAMTPYGGTSTSVDVDPGGWGGTIIVKEN